MTPANFENVTVIKKANVYFDGNVISHTVIFDDGTRKTLGVILSTEQPLAFKTELPERMELVAGKCAVRLSGDSEFEVFTGGQSFFVPGQSSFEIQAIDVTDYICHFEG